MVALALAGAWAGAVTGAAAGGAWAGITSLSSLSTSFQSTPAASAAVFSAVVFSSMAFTRSSPSLATRKSRFALGSGMVTSFSADRFVHGLASALVGSPEHSNIQYW